MLIDSHFLLTNAQMAEADRLTIASGTLGSALMEHAGYAVADVIMRHYSRLPVLVIAGPGNNGGDGYVIARLLQEAGWDVVVAALNGARPSKGDAAEAASRWSGKVEKLTPKLCASTEGIVVDALFGTGLQRPIEGEVAESIRAMNENDADIVAVDIPSGIHGDTGEILGIAIKADMTITFASKKRGHLLMPGKAHSGLIYLADIGIISETLAKVAEPVRENHPDIWMPTFPRITEEGHKYDRGHTAVLGGDISTGAARLAAHAAHRVGSGLVSVLCSEQAFPIYAAALDAIMVKPLTVGLSTYTADKRMNSWVVGPGAGITKHTKEMVIDILHTKRACVLDADALSVFKDNPGELYDETHDKVVMTPHEGEFKRLFNSINETQDKISQTLSAAQKMHGVVVYKGPDTVIADANGRVVVNGHASPYLATAGSGDVLAGLIAGLIAQGMPAFEAACAAVWMHGEAANQFGAGLVADDIPKMMPPVLQQLLSEPTAT